MSGIQLRDLLAKVAFRDDDTGHLGKWIDEILQPTLDLLQAEAERWVDQNDVDVAESDVVDAMLRDLGNPFDVAFGQPINRRRLLVRSLVQVYLTKGSAPGMTDVIRALTAIEAQVVFPATINAWVLGVDVLGDGTPPVDEDFTDEAVLGPSPGFMRYSFQVEVPRVLTSDEKEIVTEIVKLMKPAHTHFVGFLEPGAGAAIDHWELGLSELGEDTDLH